MTLYKSTCAYRDLDGEIYTDSKTVEAESKQLAKNILENYFYNKYSYLSRDHILFSTVLTVENSIRKVTATGAGSVAIGGSTNGVTIQTGHSNVNINSINSINSGQNSQIGDTYYK